MTKKNGRRRIGKRNYGNQLVRHGSTLAATSLAAAYEAGRRLWDSTAETRRYRQSEMAALRAHDRQAQEDLIANDSGKRKQPKRQMVKASTASKSKPKTKSSVVIGKSGDKFPKTRRIKKSKYAKYGVQLQYEYRGTVTDGQCVYLGYGVPAKRVIQSAWYCVVKRLFLNHGAEIENFDQSIPVPSNAATKQWTIYINYWANIASTTISAITVTHDYSAGKITYSDLVNNIVSAIDTALSAGDKPPIWQKIEMYQGIVASPSDNAVAYVQLDQARIELNYKAKLYIQNSTTAPGGDAQTKFNTDRIDINPLRGRKYSAVYTNAILPRIRDEATVAAYKPLIADQDTGLFSVTATQEAGTFGTLSTLMGGGFYKTPDASSFVSTKGVSVNLQPGEIKRDFQYFKWKGTLQRFMELVHDEVVDFTDTKYMRFGRVTMFAFEHELCQSTESNIVCDYEGDFEVAARMKFRKPRSVPVVRVQ